MPARMRCADVEAVRITRGLPRRSRGSVSCPDREPSQKESTMRYWRRMAAVGEWAHIDQRELLESVSSYPGIRHDMADRTARLRSPSLPRTEAHRRSMADSGLPSLKETEDYALNILSQKGINSAGRNDNGKVAPEDLRRTIVRPKPSPSNSLRTTRHWNGVVA